MQLRVQANPFAQRQALAGSHQHRGHHLFGQFDHAQAVARGDGAHADLVLVMAFSGPREHAGRHGLLQCFGSPRRNADLQCLQAMVDGRTRAGGGRQVGRQSMAVARIDHQRQLAVEQVGNVGDRVLQGIHRQRDVASVEVAAVQDALAIHIDQRVVVGAVQFGFDQLAQERQAVFQHADHMRCAAQRITVLQALFIARRVLAVQVAAQARGNAHLARVRFGREQVFVEVVRVAVAGQHIESGQARGHACQVVGALPGEAGQAGHHRGAVHDCQAFLRPQLQWRHADLRQHFARWLHAAVVQHLALATQHRRHVGQRGQVTTGTNRTFGRNQRQYIVLQQRSQAFQQRYADTGHATHQRGQARGQHRAGLDRVQVTAEAATMVGVQMVRQFRYQRRRNVHRARVAVAGGHTVDDAIIAQQAVEEVGTALDVRAERRRLAQRGFATAPGQGNHVFDGQGCIAKAAHG